MSGQEERERLSDSNPRPSLSYPNVWPVVAKPAGKLFPYPTFAFFLLRVLILLILLILILHFSSDRVGAGNNTIQACHPRSLLSMAFLVSAWATLDLASLAAAGRGYQDLLPPQRDCVDI